MKISLYFSLILCAAAVCNLNASQPAPMAIDSHGQQADLNIINPGQSLFGWKALTSLLQNVNDQLQRAPKNIVPDVHAIHRQNFAQQTHDARQKTIEKKRTQTEADAKGQKEFSENQKFIAAPKPTLIPFDIVTYDRNQHFHSTAKLFKNSFPNIAPDFNIDLDLQIVPYDILTINNEVAGFISYTISTDNKTEAKIIWLAIDEKFRRHGFGTILLKHTIEKLKKLSAQMVTLTALSNSLDFYLRNGFQIEPSLFEDELYLTKRI